MRIVFMGTPEFAVASLRAVANSGHDLVGVYSQPDKPKNRGMKLVPTPVKQAAVELGIPVFQPNTLKDDEVFAQLSSLSPDLIVVAAYGRILPKRILELPKFGCINVHSSLLPKYRGAAPINWAIINGEKTTGVTIMYMAEGLDTGDMIRHGETEIFPDETAQQLQVRLADLGAQLLCNTLPEIESGTAPRVPQNDAQSCYAPMLGKELSPIDFSNSAEKIKNQVRGLQPWPTATAILSGVEFKIFSVELTGENTQAPAGTVVGVDKKGINIACGDGKIIRILELQASGKKRMPAVDYLRGNPIF